MFVYTPEDFIQELRDIYSTPFKDLPNNAINTNTAYAVGRVFHTSADLELFMRFIINSSAADKWPVYPKKDFSKVYFWSVFRCLCYYEDTAQVDAGLAENVCNRICNYINGTDDAEYARKYCLCALLFLTRIRHYSPAFMEPDGELGARVIETIENMRPIKFPPAMGLSGNDGDNLCQFTLRFVRQEATEDDYAGLEGLITSMA